MKCSACWLGLYLGDWKVFCQGGSDRVGGDCVDAGSFGLGKYAWQGVGEACEAGYWARRDGVLSMFFLMTGGCAEGVAFLLGAAMAAGSNRS